MIKEKCSVGWWLWACYLRNTALCTFIWFISAICLFVGGVERGGLTEGHWRTDRKEYLRIGPNRLVFLVLFNCWLPGTCVKENIGLFSFFSAQHLVGNKICLSHRGVNWLQLLWWVIVLLPLISQQLELTCLLRASYSCLQVQTLVLQTSPAEEAGLTWEILYFWKVLMCNRK